MGGDVSIMVDRGASVVSELYKWLKDLLGLKLVDLARIRSEVSKKLAEMQVDIPYVTFWVLQDITLYLDDDYPELIKTELNISCIVNGHELTIAPNSVKPDVTVLDFIRAFMLMDGEYIETIRQTRSSTPKEEDTILDKAIAALWREAPPIESIVVNAYDLTVSIEKAHDTDTDDFIVNVTKEPFSCTYALRGHHTLRFAVDLFKKYIDTLFNTQANATMR